MPITTLLNAPRFRRGLAACAIVLAAGGLVLHLRPASAKNAPPTATQEAHANSPAGGSIAWNGPGVHGTIALSHTKVLAGGTTRVFAEMTMTADATESAKERAPLALAIVLDTSGSMAGEKIERAKESVITLVREMNDRDQVALIRYSSDSEIIQQLASVSEARESLISRVQGLSANGGTNIPPALSRGLRELSDASAGRVLRVVLVSDGLDSTRAQAEAIARESGQRGITTSSLGIGLDFDESYMGGVAAAGHGNFAFVQNASALASFLGRELKETAATTVERATTRIKLPAGVRFVRASGADATTMDDGRTVELSVGSLFAGDQRRIVMELAASVGASDAPELGGQIMWTPVGGDATRVDFAGLSLQPTSDEQAVLDSQDGEVVASATSVLASMRQLEAAQAYGQGDSAKAKALIDQNIADLKAAQEAAPSAAPALARQENEYKATAGAFATAAPASDEGKRAAKASAAKDFANTARNAF